MVRFCWVFILLMCHLGCSLIAQQPALTNLLSNGPETSQEQVTPNPSELNPNWWDAFDVQGDTYRERTIRFLNGIKEQASTLNEADDERVQPVISRIELKFNALDQAQGQLVPVTPKELDARDSYTTTELLDLLTRLERERAQLKQLKEDLASHEAALSQSQSRYDGLFGTYRSIEAGSPDRFEKGLGVVAEQINIALAREQIRISKGLISVQEPYLLAIEREWDGAQSKLVTNRSELLTNEARLASAEADLSGARRRLEQAEARAYEQFPSNQEERYRSAFLDQQAVQARVEWLIARTNVLRYTILDRLNAWLFEDEDGKLGKWPANLSDWESELSEIQTLMLAQKELSNREYDRATKASQTLGDQQSPLLDLQMRRLRTAQETLDTLQRLEGTVGEVKALHNIVRTQVLKRVSYVRRYAYYALENFRLVGSYFSTILQYSLFRIGGIPVTPFGIVRAILVLVAALWASRLARYAIHRVAEGQHRLAASTFYTLERLAHYCLLMLGVVVALASLGLDFSNLALVAGALSVGIGFGLQSIVGNFLSGLIILFEGNLKVGDFLELESGVKGRITAINVRSTVIRSNDGIEVLVPNAEIIGGRVTNWTMSDVFRRVRVPFGVAYGSDPEQVREVVLEAANGVDETLRGHPGYREPRLFMTGFGDSSLNFELVVWVNRQAAKREKATLSAYYWAIHQALTEAGIEIPFPQRDIHIKTSENHPTDTEELSPK